MFRPSSLIIALIMMGSILAGSYSLDANPIESIELNSNEVIPQEIQMDPNFIENTGFVEEGIRYIARTGFGFAAFTDNGIILNSMEFESRSIERKESDIDFNILKIQFKGSISTIPKSEGMVGPGVNFILGNHRSEAQTFSQIVYEDVWEGVDLIYYFSDDQLKYDVRIEDSSSLNEIGFSVDGADHLEISEGALNIVVNEEHVVFDAGLLGYYNDGTKDPVNLEFKITGDSSYGFVGHDIEDNRPFVIDPIITSTYYGGGLYESPGGMAVDGDGDIYLTGMTASFDFPTTTGAYSTAHSGHQDGYVMKMKKDMSALHFSTFIGGKLNDDFRGIAVGKEKCVYVTGTSLSTDFPTTKGAFNETNNNATLDIVAFKLDPMGKELSYSTYIGGTDMDAVSGFDCINVDSNGCMLILGTSSSKDYPTTKDAYDDQNPSSSPRPPSKVTLTKLSNDGSYLVYSTYIGGTGGDYSSSFEMDDEGYAYIVGQTDSKNFPVSKNAFMSLYRGWSCTFVMKFDISKSSVVYSTYFNTDTMVSGNDIVVDGQGRAIITGSMCGNDLPTTPNAYDTEINGWSDAFVAKFDAQGSNLVFCTVIGGSENEDARSVDILSDDRIVITGYTMSEDYPTTVNCDVHINNYFSDAILTVFESDGTDLYYSSLFGHKESDEGYIVETIEDDDVLITGVTESNDFPITDGAFDKIFNGENDCFILRFNFSVAPSIVENLDLSKGDHFIRLDWNEPSDNGGMDVTGYRVYRTEMVMEGETEMFNTTDTFYNDTDVEPGSKYAYFVRPVNDVGEGKPSEVKKAKAIEVTSSPNRLEAEWNLDRVSLSWIMPFYDGFSIIRGYNLYKYSVDLDKLEKISLEVHITSYDDKDVSFGNTYSYWISCLNDAGESNSSKKVSILPIGISAPPMDPAFTRYSGGVEINWSYPEFDGGSPIKEYVVEREDEKGNIWNRNINGTKLNDSDVEIGSTYSYRIRAVNDAGESTWTDPLEVLIMSKPACPLEVKSHSKNGAVMITWKEPEEKGSCDITGYRIYRIENDLSQLIEEVDMDVSMVTIDGLTNGEEYYYSVAALNPLGESDPSETVICKPCTTPTQPLDPIAAIGDGIVTLTWSSPDDDGGSPVSGYLIIRSVDGEESVPLFETEIGILTFDDLEVDNGVSYMYTVRAKNSAGMSNPSDEVEATPGGPPSIIEPRLAEGSTGSIKLEWDTPSNNGGRTIERYHIYRSESENGPFDLLYETTETWVTDDNVEFGREYFYRITAVTEIGESPLSDAITALSIGLPDTVVIKTVTEDSNGIVTIVWDAPSFDGGSEITSYRIYRWIEGEGPSEIGMVSPDFTSFKDHSVSEGATYSYAVSAANIEGIGNMSASIQFTTDEENEDEDKGNLVIFVIIGIAIILLLVILIFLLLKRKRTVESMVQLTPVHSGNEYEPITQPEPILGSTEYETMGSIETLDTDGYHEMLPESDQTEEIYELPIPRTL